jgi:AraC-like DNA-binding protein
MKNNPYSGSERQLIDTTIRNHYENVDFNVSRMCHYLRTNPSSLREITIRNYGLLPKNLIENIRLEYSLHLLLLDLKIIEISEQAGYANSRSFRAAFKKRFHVTPSEFRKMINRFTEDRRVNLVLNCKRILWG